MTKEELKQQVSKLKLDNELKELIYELVDGSAEVNQELLNGVADILDTQATFLENSADVLAEEIEEYDDLKEELNLIDEEEKRDKVSAVAQNHAEILSEVKSKVSKLQGEVNTVSEPSEQVASQTPSPLEQLNDRISQNISE